MLIAHSLFVHERNRLCTRVSGATQKRSAETSGMADGAEVLEQSLLCLDRSRSRRKRLRGSD